MGMSFQEAIELYRGIYHRFETVSYTHLDVYKRQRLYHIAIYWDMVNRE